MATDQPGGRHHGHLCHGPASDHAVADALHTGLERLASSWRQRRALHIHRGTAGTDVLAGCEWLVLLASPGAAASPEVEAHLEWWLSERGPGTILPVLVDGTWTWQEADGDFRWQDPDAVTAVPRALRRVFTEEPRHMDLTWTSGEPDLTLRNPRFRDQVAELAAPMHGVTKEDLESEDVRQQRRNRRMARLAVVSLAVLAVIALVAAALAVAAQREADDQRELADLEAERAAARARVATGHRLATVATSDADLAADVRLLLAAEAARLAPGPQADAALFQLLSDPTLSDAETAVVGTGVRSDFTALAGHDLGVDPNAVVLDGDGAVVRQQATGEISRFTGPAWTEVASDLPAGAALQALGGDGRLAVVTRQPSGGQPLLGVYDDFSNVPPEEDDDEAGLTTVREPFPCNGCEEAVLIDLDTGAETALPTEIGLPPGWGNPDVRFPEPMVPRRFSDDGTFLVAFSPLGGRLFSIPTTGGDPLLVETTDTVFDFGIVDDERGWQLTAGELQVFDLTSGAIVDQHVLAGIDGVTAADIDIERGLAVIGSAPSTYTVLDLASGEVLTRRDTGTAPGEIAIGPDGHWLAVAGPDRAELLALETLTPVASAPTRFFRVEDHAAEVAFDAGGRYLLVRPANSAPAKVYVFLLETEQWYRAACAAAGRMLTPEEWDRYVGLPTEEPACSGASDRNTSIPVTSGETSTTVEPTTTTTQGSTTTTTTGAPAGDGPGPDCSRIEDPILEQMFPDGNYDEERCRSFMREG